MTSAVESQHALSFVNGTNGYLFRTKLFIDTAKLQVVLLRWLQTQI